MRMTIRAILCCLASVASLVQAQPGAPLPQQKDKASRAAERIGEADLSGRWVGILEIPGRNGGPRRSLPFQLILKQNGTTLTGGGGSDPTDLDELSNGSIEGDKVRFDLPDDYGVRMHAKLMVDGKRLTGELSSSGGPTLKLSLKQVPYATAEELRPRRAEVEALIQAEFAKRPIGSVTVGLVSGTRLVWAKSYGQADMEKKTPAANNTVYRIGSVTKMFTALMLHQLAERGKVHLSDPVEKYFPEVKNIPGRYVDAPPITLIQLATHTAGLSREPDGLPQYVKGPVSEWEKVLIAGLPRIRYEFEPGTRHSYSNMGYAILGAALSRAVGEPYTEYVRKRIFEPLGMKHSAFEPNPEMRMHLSVGYQVQGEKTDSETARQEHQGRGYKVPNGAIYTTVEDLARFASFLLGAGPESVLKTARLERTLSQRAVQADPELSSGYGQGFQVKRSAHGTFLGHSGGVVGYQAALYVNRKTGVAVVILANAVGTLNTQDLALRSLDILSKP